MRWSSTCSAALVSSTDGKRTILLYQSLRRYYTKHYSQPKQVAVNAMVGANALWRLAAIAGMHAATKVGVDPGQKVWELVTQQQAKSDWDVMYKTWWKTIWVTPDDPIRP